MAHVQRYLKIRKLNYRFFMIKSETKLQKYLTKRKSYKELNPFKK